MTIRFPVSFELDSSPRSNAIFGANLQEISAGQRLSNQAKLAQTYIKNLPLSTIDGITSGNNVGAGVGDYLLISSSGFDLTGSGHTFSVQGMSAFPQDTYLIAGAGTSNKKSFRTEAQTPDVSTKTVNYDRIAIARNTAVSSTAPTFPENRKPLYWTGTELRAMTVADIDDTFIKPAILRLTGDTDPDSVRFNFTPYAITTSENTTDYSVVSNTNGTKVVFNDHRADVANFNTNQIPEAQEQIFSVNTYFLQRYTGPTNGTPRLVCYDDGLREMPDDFFDTHMVQRMAYYTKHVTGFRISYAFNANYPSYVATPIEEQIMGTTMLNTKYSGSSYRKRKVNDDDYRTQEFPAFAGSETASEGSTDNSYRLKIVRF